MQNYELGTRVIRIAATTDYTNGRQGDVVDYDETKNRYRVFWTHEASGREMTDKKRTWVKADALKLAA